MIILWFVAAYSALLSTDKNIQIIGEAGTSKEGIELARRLDPDIVILDLKLPDMDGLTIAKRLLHHNSEINILVVSANIQDLTILRLLEAGAKGYISKSASAHRINAGHPGRLRR